MIDEFYYFLMNFTHSNLLISITFAGNYSAPPMGMSNRLTVVLQQELH